MTVDDDAMDDTMDERRATRGGLITIILSCINRTRWKRTQGS